MFQNYYMIVSTQVIPENITNTLVSLNEIIDMGGNYYISIPLFMESCVLGEIYGIYENLYIF